MKSATLQSRFSIPYQKRTNATRSALLLLLLSDLLVVFISTVLAFVVRFQVMENSLDISPQRYFEIFGIHIILATLSLPAYLYFKEAYSIKHLTRYKYGAMQMLAHAFSWSVIFLAGSLFVNVEPAISRIWVALTGTFAGIGLAISRYVFCKDFLGQSLLESIRRRTIILGWTQAAETLENRSRADTEEGHFFPFDVKACLILKEQMKAEASYPKHLQQIESPTSLESRIAAYRADTLILADSNLDSQSLQKIQEICARELVDFMMVPDFVHTLNSCLRVESIAQMPLLTQTRSRLDNGFNALLKRLFDIVGASLGLLLSAPIMAFFCWRVYRESPGPVFYRQVRTGKRGKHFEMIKIRSMQLDAEKESGAKWCSVDDPRRLSIGTFMRKYNIDELPQFWNVLKGDMSLVGPRPERPELIREFKHQISFYNVRHTITPGMTGWAQVNGWRGDTSLQARIASDLEYIERWSLWLDIYICFKTLYTTKNAY